MDIWREVHANMNQSDGEEEGTEYPWDEPVLLLTEPVFLCRESCTIEICEVRNSPSVAPIWQSRMLAPSLRG